MGEMTCPKCHFRQPEGKECRSCGIVFSKYEKLQREGRTPSTPSETETRSGSGWFWPTFRILRWTFLAASLTGLVLVLVPSEPPPNEVDPQARESAEKKITHFQRQIQKKQPTALKLSDKELNSWVKRSLGNQTERLTPPTSEDEKTGSHEVRDVAFELEGDLLTAHLLIDLYGKETSFQIETRIRTGAGGLELEPVSGKLGNLPLPVAVLERAVERLTSSAANQEVFQLPPYIDSVQVKDSQLEIRSH